MHWAAPLIGKPWSPDGAGPDAFSCWGLVCHVFHIRHGVQMPMVRVGDDDNVAAIKRASEVSGWCLAEEPAQADDILLLRGMTGRRHVGLMVDLNGKLVVLHANGSLREDGTPMGCVERQALQEVLAEGYREPEFWRRA